MVGSWRAEEDMGGVGKGGRVRIVRVRVRRRCLVRSTCSLRGASR